MKTFGPLPACAAALSAVIAIAAASSTARADQYSLMPALTPDAADITHDSPDLYELGTKFQSSVSGDVVALRYWLTSDDAVTHVGHLWDGSGDLLASATFTDSGTGWQQVTLSTPILISANQTYVVSVNVAVSYPATDDDSTDSSQDLAASIVSGPLHTVADGHNGVYIETPGAFPTKDFGDSNYYRDVVFQTLPAPEPASLTLLSLGGLLLIRRRR